MRVPVSIVVNGRRYDPRGRTAAAARSLHSRSRRPDRHEGRLRHQPVRRLHGAPRRRRVRSCTALAVQADGSDGHHDRGARANGASFIPLQEAFWNKHGLQCGFCTPGMIMAAHELLRTNPQSDRRGDPPRPRRQHLPLHRISEHRPRRAGCRDGGRDDGERVDKGRL